KIVISSSIPGEGKTTTSSNVAVSLSQIDKKVLLIDGDLRKSKVHKAMNLPNTPGLTNVLSGLSSLDKSVNKTKSPNLNVLCSGISVPNPSEMLASGAMSDLLTELEASYDYIIIDTPPINVVADSLPLIKISDGILIVVRPYYTTHIELQKTIKSLEFIDAKILGFVLNNTHENKMSKYKYKNKYNYSYGYNYK
ncbi:MAG: hypothetical protein K0S55_1267, partial [Clostridia bacterium]|nr:hypothetical protein [Clostridia bacterium]